MQTVTIQNSSPKSENLSRVSAQQQANINDSSITNPEKKKPSKNTRSKKLKKTLKKIVVVLIVLLLLGVCYFALNSLFKSAFGLITDSVEAIMNLNIVLRVGLFSAIIASWGIFFLPFQSGMMVLISYFERNFITCMLIIFLAQFSSFTITFFLSRKCLSSCLKRKFKDSDAYKVIMACGQKKGLPTVILLRLVYVPAGLKNYLIPQTEIPYGVFILGSMPITMIMGAIYVSVGLGLEKVDDIMSPRSFNEKSVSEKVQQIVSYIFMILTLAVVIFFCYYLNKEVGKLGEKKRKEFEKKNEKNEKKGIDEEEAQVHQEELEENAGVVFLNNEIQRQKPEEEKKNDQIEKGSTKDSSDAGGSSGSKNGEEGPKGENEKVVSDK